MDLREKLIKIIGEKCPESCQIGDLEDIADNLIVNGVTVQEHGRWIMHPDDLFPTESMQECSVCHEQEFFTLINEQYCPNCGAKMDLPEPPKGD